MKTQVIYVAVEVSLQEDSSGDGSVPSSETIQQALTEELDGLGVLDVDGWVYDLEVLTTSPDAAFAAQSVKAVKVARKFL